MKHNLQALAIAAVLAMSSLASQAADTVYAGDIIKGSTTFTFAGAFSKSYEYTFDPVGFPDPVAGEVAFSFTELKFKNVIDIDFGSISLIDGNGVTVWTGVPSATSGPADTVSFDGVVVTTRDFTVNITGTSVGTGANKGSYSFELTAAPVPEPSSYGLAIAGLAVAGAVARRRRAA